jgi:hypothetical protein
MPGYRVLPDTLAGGAADWTREGARLEEQGDFRGALLAYERAMAEALTHSPVLPGFICGRLAALYRRLGRNDDEVDLLESYRNSQVCEKARMRYDARLSKARALADKARKRDSGALASVRAITNRRRASLLAERENEAN